jgi:large subunit ribosomal protein L16
MILFEVGGIDKALAAEALRLAASKLPIRTKIAFKPTKD